MRLVTRQEGQAVLLLVAAMAAVLVGAVFLGAVAQGIGKGGREQRAADQDGLERARAEIEHAAQQAHIELVALFGQQAHAFTFTLPLARGLA